MTGKILPSFVGFLVVFVVCFAGLTACSKNRIEVKRSDATAAQNASSYQLGAEAGYWRISEGKLSGLALSYDSNTFSNATVHVSLLEEETHHTLEIELSEKPKKSIQLSLPFRFLTAFAPVRFQVFEENSQQKNFAVLESVSFEAKNISILAVKSTQKEVDQIITSPVDEQKWQDLLDEIAQLKEASSTSTSATPVVQTAPNQLYFTTQNINNPKREISNDANLFLVWFGDQQQGITDPSYEVHLFGQANCGGTILETFTGLTTNSKEFLATDGTTYSFRVHLKSEFTTVVSDCSAPVAVDTSPPPALAAFSSGTGTTVGSGPIDVTVTFPSDTSDYHQVSVIRLQGGVAPSAADCLQSIYKAYLTTQRIKSHL